MEQETFYHDDYETEDAYDEATDDYLMEVADQIRQKLLDAAKAARHPYADVKMYLLERSADTLGNSICRLSTWKL